MSTIEEIKTYKVKDLDFDRMKRWLSDEIFSLADDFGQKLDIEQAKHIANRLKYTLTAENSKFRNWGVWDVHTTFQKGLTGAFGKSSKVTFQILVNWLWSEERARRGENVNTQDPFDKESMRQTDEDKRRSKRYLPFLKWCLLYNVDINKLCELKEQPAGVVNTHYETWVDEFHAIGPEMMNVRHLPNFPRLKNVYESISQNLKL